MRSGPGRAPMLSIAAKNRERWPAKATSENSCKSIPSLTLSVIRSEPGTLGLAAGIHALSRQLRVASILGILAATLPAQDYRAKLTGEVLDASGAPTPKVRVELTNKASLVTLSTV